MSYINRSKTTKARQARHIGYDAASGHNSETDPLLPTKDLAGMASPPCSVPPMVRRANLLLDTWPALHTLRGDFAVFLRESIKRVTISGMILLVVALANDVGGLDVIYKTHTTIPLRIRSRSVRFTFITVFWAATYSAGRGLIAAYERPIVSSGTQIDRLAHRCKNISEN